MRQAEINIVLSGTGNNWPHVELQQQSAKTPPDAFQGYSTTGEYTLQRNWTTESRKSRIFQFISCKRVATELYQLLHLEQQESEREYQKRYYVTKCAGDNWGLQKIC